MENIVIIGSSGHAKSIIDVVEKEGKYRVVGLLDDYRVKGERTLEYSILGGLHDLSEIIEKNNIYGGIIGIGHNWDRNEVYTKIKNLHPEFNYVNSIHPSVQIGKNVKIGKGTVVMPGAIINIDSQIGDHCILNTGAYLDHEGIMENFSSLGPGAVLGGNVKVGEKTAVCLGAKVINKITIGKESIIGSGSVIVKNIGDSVVVYGIPGKVIRINKGERYL